MKATRTKFLYCGDFSIIIIQNYYECLNNIRYTISINYNMTRITVLELRYGSVTSYQIDNVMSFIVIVHTLHILLLNLGF